MIEFILFQQGLYQKDNLFVPLSVIHADPESFEGVLFSLEMPRGMDHGGAMEKFNEWHFRILCGVIASAVLLVFYYLLTSKGNIVCHVIICALVGHIIFISKSNEKVQPPSSENPDARDRHNVIQIYASRDEKGHGGSGIVVFLLLVPIVLLIVGGVFSIDSKSGNELIKVLQVKLLRLTELIH